MKRNCSCYEGQDSDEVRDPGQYFFQAPLSDGAKSGRMMSGLHMGMGRGRRPQATRFPRHPHLLNNRARHTGGKKQGHPSGGIRSQRCADIFSPPRETIINCRGALEPSYSGKRTTTSWISMGSSSADRECIDRPVLARSFAGREERVKGADPVRTRGGQRCRGLVAPPSTGKEHT